MKKYKDSEKAAISREFFEKGYILQMSGHLDRASKFYKRSIEFLPTAKAHTFLGWIFSMKGLYDRAIDECKNAIKLDPSFGNPYNDIGAYLIQQKKYTEAVDWLEKALHAPNYENYCFPNINLGRVYEQKGDWNKALRYYQKAITENPEYKPAQMALEKLTGKYN
ncbi:MAG: tetratricopeptide repeat protein [Calditrichaceae bacterium]